MKTKKKIALVISGGGSKGAFAVGVIKYLKEHFPEIEFDIFVGTSTGSLIVPMAAVGRIDLLEELFTTVKTEEIVLGGNVGARLLKSVSLFDANPLAEKIKEYYHNEQAEEIRALGKQIFFATTCLQTSGAVIFSTKEPPTKTEYDFVELCSNSEFRLAIMASAFQPVFMQPIEVHAGAIPLMQYVDGGVREYLGIQVAIDAGATEIYAISLTPMAEEIELKEYKSAIDILFKTLAIFSTQVKSVNLRIPAVYNNALRYIEAVKQKMSDAGESQKTITDFFNVPHHEEYVNRDPVIIRHIFPSESLGGGPGGLRFDPAEMEGMLKSGELQAEYFMTKLLAKNNAA